MPGAGSDLGGRAPEASHSDSAAYEVVGAAGRPGACPVLGMAAARAWCQTRP